VPGFLDARQSTESAFGKTATAGGRPMKILSEERGNILILAALSMTMLLSFMAMAIDVGNLYYTQRKLQTLADAAAMAGALEIDTCAGTKNCDVMKTAAKSALTENGSPAATVVYDSASASPSGTGLLLIVNNGPLALGGSDPNAGSQYYVEAVVAKQVPTYFAKIFGKSTTTISARAEAGKAAPSGPCFDIVGDSGQTLTLNSGAKITDAAGSTCGINVNSNGTPAVMENSGATVNVGSYTVNGTVTNNGATTNPAPTSGSTVADPYASLTAPSKGTTQSSGNLSISGTKELSAGYYSGGLNFNGGTYTVTLDPGVYYMDGNVMVGTGVTLSGTGVTIYMASGQLNVNSGAIVNLTAPSSGSTAGLVIWQAKSDTNEMILDAGSNSSWGGSVYVPGGQLTLNSNSGASSYGMIVAKSAMVNATISLSGGSSGGSHNGSLTIALAE
jgi:Flp pilus assembly protein TadG